MSTSDYHFACEKSEGAGGPWAHLRVVRFHGHEAISTLYRYEVTLFAKAPAPEVDPHELVRSRATLRIKTLTAPEWRVVHGVVTEAEELYALPDGMLYRVIVEPPLVRARHRKRCRVFVDKTLRQIVDAVLTGDPNLSKADGATVEPDDGDDQEYSTALEQYTWRTTDASRLDSPAARPYVVQYNESDLAFVSRLLEEEGIAYHYESGRGQCLLVLSDSDAGRTKLEPFEPLATDIDGREVSTVKLGARMRPKAVVLDDYNWRKPALDMQTETRHEDPAAEGFFEYEWPGGYPDAPSQGAPLARARVDRYEVEGEYALAEVKARLLGAGVVFRMQHQKARYEGEYLVTKMDVHGFQEGVASKGAGQQGEVPFACTVELARRGKQKSVTESRYRPALATPRPRIIGSQTAFVTAEPNATGAEINVGGPQGGEIGCVRLKFHWDRDTERHAKEPTSTWVRVSQVFAGGGQGGVWHPRVGVEVIVDFVDGDPDRPLVTGRVYNGQNRPAWGPDAATKSSLKSFTSPHDGKFNELSFEDKAGGEEMKQHAARDWTAEVGHDRNESVANDSGSSVGVNRTESTGANRSASIGANNSEVVGANASLAVGANQSVAVGVNQTVMVGANQSTSVGADGSASYGGNLSVGVMGNQSVAVMGNASTSIGGTQSTVVVGTDAFTASGAQSLHSDASQTMSAPAQTFAADATQTLTSTLHSVIASAIASRAAGAIATTDAPVTIVSGDAVLVLTGSTTIMAGSSISINYGDIALNGGTVDVKAGQVSVDGGGSIEMKAGVIKLN
jgi:type VI secretion system secreted protein VgrG